jgi:methionyl-tRNA formyltransferase
MRSKPGAVKALAQARGLEIFQPETLRSPEVAARLRAARADAMVVAAYGLLLPPAVLQVAAHGAINIHASLLPRWRGAAPIQRALLAGDRETGVSIMRMDQGLDTGPVFAQRALAIDADDDSGALHDKLAELGAQTLLEVLASITSGRTQARAQVASGVTYAPKIEKGETRLHWEHAAAELERAVRAFRPSPGALARLAGDPVKIWRARVVGGAGAPGTVLDAGEVLRIACGSEALAIDELQPAGGRRMSVGEFLRGRRIAPGTRLE